MQRAGVGVYYYYLKPPEVTKVSAYLIVLTGTVSVVTDLFIVDSINYIINLDIIINIKQQLHPLTSNRCKCSQCDTGVILICAELFLKAF